MKAKAKPFECIDFDSLGISNITTQETLSIKAPAERKEGQIVGSVSELVTLLRDEAKVIA